jgi:hypothetical protein
MRRVEHQGELRSFTGAIAAAAAVDELSDNLIVGYGTPGATLN